MRTFLTLAGFMLSVGVVGPAVALDLPPDVLADQYLLEATKALEKGDPQQALKAFGKIEALDTEPPGEFLYFYGKLLVETSTAVDGVRKGQSLLKQFIINVEKASEHYQPTLKLLSVAERKIEAAERRRVEDTKQHPAAAQRAAGFKELLPSLLESFKQQMVPVRGGTFTMGCTSCLFCRVDFCFDSSKPAHQVQVKSFTISKYEVTQELWEAVMGENPSHFQGCGQCPVESVSWKDVQEFLKKVNALTGERYRLPTEAEWEYAARGGQQSRGYAYAGSDASDSVAWYDENSGAQTHPVGQKAANELGLYDMTGNVGEWVEDCWHVDYEGAPSDGSAWESEHCERRVVRGGSWFYTLFRGVLYSVYRNRAGAGFRNAVNGVRLARTP